VGFLRAETGDAQLAEQIRADYTKVPMDDATRALLDLAVKVTREPWAGTRDDIQGLRRLGFTDEAILDAIQVIALFNFTNRVATALGVEVNEGYATLGVKSEAL
jgi:uncharacterized peroxidase-related enzyme